MSGGQKQRIAVARAVYANADVYLFDDPLSALDSKVGRQVFRACIAGELAGKTRLLVTNQLQYVPEADKVVVLKDGRVAEAGAYKDLMARKNGVLAEMMHDVQTDMSEEGACAARAVSSQRVPTHGAHAFAFVPVTRDGLVAEKAEQVVPAKSGKLSDKFNASPTHPGPRGPSAPMTAPVVAPGGLTSAESRATGVVSAGVLMAYARAMGGLPVFLQLITLYMLIEALRNAASVWLSVWTASSDSVDGGDAPPPADALLRAAGMLLRAAHKAASSKALFYLAVFCAISFAQVRSCMHALTGPHHPTRTPMGARMSVMRAPPRRSS